VAPRTSERGTSRAIRLAVAIAVGLAVTLGAAGPASAHGGQDDTSNFRSEITSDTTDGLTWRVLGGDGTLELHSRGAARVVVFGYEGEPYLRFDPDGTVWRNAASPSAYLNVSNDASAPVPPEASTEADPRWEQVAEDGTFAWHDHRTHWMSARPPIGDQAEVVQEWSVPFAVGDAERVQLTGELWWAPSSDPWAWLLVAMAAMTVPLVAAVRRGGSPTAAARVLGIEAVVVAMLNIVRALDDVINVDATTAEHTGVLLATGFWVVLSMLAAQRLLRRPAQASLVTVAIAGISLSWGLGITTLSALSAPFVQTGLPVSVVRAIVAVTVALAVPTVITGVLVERRDRATLVERRRPVSSAA